MNRRCARHSQLDVLEDTLGIPQNVLQIPRDDHPVRWLNGAKERLVGVFFLEQTAL